MLYFQVDPKSKPNETYVCSQIFLNNRDIIKQNFKYLYTEQTNREKIKQNYYRS